MQGYAKNSWFFDKSRRRFENLTNSKIFVQNLNGALNRPILYASYSKFVESSIQYLLSYGCLKLAPCRLK